MSSTRHFSGALIVIASLVAACTADETDDVTVAPSSPAPTAAPTPSAPSAPALLPPANTSEPVSSSSVTTSPQPPTTTSPIDVAARAASIARDTTRIELVHEETFTASEMTWEVDFYRNGAYECGLSGNYTFLVLNPADDPDAAAPLWVYLHGGGNGYWDDAGAYQSTKGQTEDTWNHEETFEDLWNRQVLRRTIADGQPIDQTLARRIREGYRLLVVSMCDHDFYSGLGTPYPNHPTNPDAEANGHQATMAAIDYTAANYPTNHVWAHGTSAGSVGVWALASSYGHEGRPLTGVVADSGAATLNAYPVHDAFNERDLMRREPTFEPEGVIEKVGFYVDPDVRAYPEAQIAELDFRSGPVLFIAGDADPFCAGQLPAIPEAAAAGLSNCGFTYSSLNAAIADQVDSPHELHVLPDTGHVPTNSPGPANDLVDAFIARVLANDPAAFHSR